jgi:sec-independent protein translocase protein TatB
MSIPHLVILFVVALLVFGPEKLPELARMLGKAMAEFRRVTTDVRRVVEDEMRDLELKNREVDLRRRETELAAEREKSIMPPGGAATTPAEIVSGNAPPEGQHDAPVEGTVPSARPKNLSADPVTVAAVPKTPETEENPDVDAHNS